VALAIGAGVLGALVATKPEPAREHHDAEPVTVRAMTATPTPVTRQLRGYGVARAVRAANVSAEVEGVVVDKPEQIEEGARVDRGQLLARIDPSDYEARVRSIERSIEAIRAQVDQLAVEAGAAREQADLAAEAADVIDREIARLRQAADRGAATEQEIDRQLRDRIAVVRDRVAAEERLAAIEPRRAALKAQIAALEADLAAAERNLERTDVLSPITGFVQTVNVEEGERVSAGELIARVVDASRIEAPLRLPLSAADSVKVGDAAVLIADSPDGGSWPARVVRLAPEADPDARTITVYVEVEQDVPEGRAPSLPPGRFVLGTVFVDEPEPRLIVPRGAVADDRVMVVRSSGEIESRSVEVAFYIESDHPELVEGESQWAVLERGLDPGETIAVSNIAKLRPGMPVSAAAASQIAERSR
jgi:RND family efflux transporter MFP subunit